MFCSQIIRKYWTFRSPKSSVWSFVENYWRLTLGMVLRCCLRRSTNIRRKSISRSVCQYRKWTSSNSTSECRSRTPPSNNSRRKQPSVMNRSRTWSGRPRDSNRVSSPTAAPNGPDSWSAAAEAEAALTWTTATDPAPTSPVSSSIRGNWELLPCPGEPITTVSSHSEMVARRWSRWSKIGQRGASWEGGDSLRLLLEEDAPDRGLFRLRDWKGKRERVKKGRSKDFRHYNDWQFSYLHTLKKCTKNLNRKRRYVSTRSKYVVWITLL